MNVWKLTRTSNLRPRYWKIGGKLFNSVELHNFLFQIINQIQFSSTIDCFQILCFVVISKKLVSPPHRRLTQCRKIPANCSESQHQSTKIIISIFSSRVTFGEIIKGFGVEDLKFWYINREQSTKWQHFYRTYSKTHLKRFSRNYSKTKRLRRETKNVKKSLKFYFWLRN